MTYLRSCLTAPALDLIVSYKNALAAPQESYTDKDPVKQHLCHLLLGLKPPAYNLSELSTNLNDYQSIIRNLRLLDDTLLCNLQFQVETSRRLHKHYYSVDCGTGY